MQAAIDAFLRALADRGITPRDFRPDGQIHRCGSTKKPRSRNGAYCLHLDGKVPAGWFQNHEDGLGVTKWRAEHTAPMTEAERLAWGREMERRRAERENERRALHRSAAARAERIWERTGEATASHPYLQRKNIKPHDLGVYRGLLVVPMFDVTGALVNLQFIAADGTKKFLKDGRKRGCYHAIGEPDNDPDGLCIGEGFATMATVNEDSGEMSVVAFDCGNLQAVGEAWRRKLPDARIVFCADDDKAGMDSAYRAARAVPNSAVVYPPRKRVAA